jgi:predicted RNA-binding Zn ribbon-like protein
MESNLMSDTHTFEMGEALCLDFSNTISGARDFELTDHLTDYASLVDWSRQAGVISGKEADSLLQEAKRQPEQAQAVFARARLLRESIYAIFSRLNMEQPPEETDLETLNRELAKTLGRAQIIQHAQDFAWSWRHDSISLDMMLGPIARSAADLLTSSDLPQVRECANDECNWLFVDRSRNHSRQWCDMSSCGNVAKVRRYRARKRR